MAARQLPQLLVWSLLPTGNICRGVQQQSEQQQQQTAASQPRRCFCHERPAGQQLHCWRFLLQQAVCSLPALWVALVRCYMEGGRIKHRWLQKLGCCGSQTQQQQLGRDTCWAGNPVVLFDAHI